MRPYAPPLDNRRTYRGLLLDFNERTVPPSQGVRRALQKFATRDSLQVYPEYFDIIKRVARYVKSKPGNILLTNGSEQGMDLVFRTFTEVGDQTIIPTPSYSMFYQFAALCGNKVLMPTYSATGAFPLSDVLESITEKTKLIVICNPNNPTSTLISSRDIVRIARVAKNAIIYIDEAYAEFAGISAISLIKRYPNIVISRTFSKAFGLGSLRVGYLVASPMYIAEFLKVRGPYDINMAAWHAAKVALQEQASMRRYVREVMKQAKPLVEKFFAEIKVPYLPSRSNFILFRPINALRTFEILRANGFLTRLQNRPPFQDTLRVTIGTVSQMKQFVAAYREKVLQKYVFLDRDGTLIWEPPDTRQIDKLNLLRILPGVVGGLKKLQQSGYRLILVTNQDGLGTSVFSKKSFLSPHRRMLKIFREQDIIFDAVFICPHLPSTCCICRKPNIGLLENWWQKNQDRLDRNSSFVCGDRPSDKQFSKNLGLRFIQMKTNGSFEGVIKKLSHS